MKKQYLLLPLILFSLFFNSFAQVWTECDNGLRNYWIESLAVSGTNIYAGTWGDSYYYTTDNGNNWLYLVDRCELDNISSFAAFGTYIYVGSDRGICFSKDDGISWGNYGLLYHNVTSLIVNGKNIFAGTRGTGVFLTTNSGNDWTEVNIGLTDLNVLCLGVTENGKQIYAGTQSGVFTTRNNGTSWTKVNKGLPDTIITSFAFHVANFFVGTFNGVFRSSDNGTNWTKVNNGLPDIPISCLQAIDNFIFAGTPGGGIYITSNNGVSWIGINNGLTEVDIQCFALSGQNIYAGAARGHVFKLGLFTLGTEESNNLEYSNIEPNPVIDYLHIKSNNTIGKIEIFSALGIKVLETEYKDRIDVSRLSAGVYFVRLADRVIQFVKL